MANWEHGHYEIRLEEGVLICYVHQAYNEFTARSFGLDIARYYDSLPKPWAMIYILDQAYPSSSALEQSTNNTLDFVRAGLSAVAFAFEKQDAKQFTKSIMREFYEKFSVDVAFLESFEQAWAWVMSSLPGK